MDFGLHFPIRLIYALIGFPMTSRKRSSSTPPGRWPSWLVHRSIRRKRPWPAGCDGSGPVPYDAVKEAVVEVRRNGAEGNDLISRLIRATYEGRSLDDHEITTFVRSLLPAAGETTTRTFGSLMVLLLERPDVLDRVRKDRPGAQGHR
jgi:cytochrome P450